MSMRRFHWCRFLSIRSGVRLLYRALRGREGRTYAWLRLTSPVPLFQDYATTSMDRYPTLFSFAQQTLGAERHPRLLSFGCASGEEVFSLRAYFPNAAITGLDIHHDSIRACLRQLRDRPDPGLRFRVAGDTTGEADGAYDAIFCLAVLRRGDLAAHPGERCDHLIRFEDVEAQLLDFARCLRPGGLLVLRHANFRLRDTQAARWFDTALCVPTPARADTPLFGPDNRRLAVQADEQVVFRRCLAPRDQQAGLALCSARRPR
ncbi:class I SAM-dependent methyltransferase [Xanthomonas rydalmerensis]|uniref:Class I SAM-dependent methyltransferase n=1 Tax=Xanthomonas rydalmerensis TaxID=3046274 RepID=A0ABZ0JLJ4_9XANT|nr:class I SAM-dependent methyltransferase [Xanthomonas sp. DM-2023]WOS40490.1 class I SAM-dependent methyltransferase [Xanthomonas sp. DM-2023]WOS44674.1 class I SAM-dependent methyltransferase [Xanthomonas sp. DM-2023]WOS48854.1 class I SAM-dependent methyltransferase [Xanthomonas sp. DM-2023]WOS53034.1 class I SAM-dependent methyltransferase [Xanthomonas sp. DM-2023]WOS57218.1 class I SAM-dependent methyltransferase [Xanthomonas sp. DM-2023]